MEHSNQANQKIHELANSYHVSIQSIKELLSSLSKSDGRMAQFNIPELGGQGQWMKGGMVLLSNSSNEKLKKKVDALCTELSQSISGASQEMNFASEETKSSNNWWPKKLGPPDASGGQNNFSYAYFSKTQRLLIKQNDHIKTYDTDGHDITGISQQQSADPQTIAFTGPQGKINLKELKMIGDGQ